LSQVQEKANCSYWQANFTNRQPTNTLASAARYRDIKVGARALDGADL
jgi:hypothetical protein